MYVRASLVVQRLKHLPAMWETWVRSLGREDPLEKEMATHSSILAWRIPRTEELGGLQSTGSKESDTTERLHFTSSLLYLKMKVAQLCPSDYTVSPWNSPGQNTGIGSDSLLQGIFPTQGWNPGLPRCRRILYQLSHQGSSS